MAARPHLFGMLPEDLVRHARAEGIEIQDDEARRILARTIAGETRSRRPLSKRLLAAIEPATDRRPLEVVERAEDPSDRFVKYLFRSPDGALSEAVRIPLHAEGRFSVCLSSQVGCAMGCVFCATGRLGFTRDLEAWEMVAAFTAVRDEAPGRVTGAVFQGQGEPFANYDRVIQAARVLSHPCGGRIAAQAITISTVGIAAEIRRFAREGHRYRLIVSLTSARPETRARLLPVAGRTDLVALADAIREYAATAKGRITVAWVVLGGVNTSEDEARALHRLLGDLPLRVNLVDVNDARPDGFRRADDAERRAFVDRLQILSAPVVRRYSGGASRHAACGMLAAVRTS